MAVIQSPTRSTSALHWFRKVMEFPHPCDYTPHQISPKRITCPVWEWNAEGEGLLAYQDHAQHVPVGIGLQPTTAWGAWTLLVSCINSRYHLDIRIFRYQEHVGLTLTAYKKSKKKFSTLTYIINRKDLSDPYVWGIKDPKIFIVQMFRDLCHQFMVTQGADTL